MSLDLPLDANDVTRCVHRIALDRGEDATPRGGTISVEIQRRVDAATLHRRHVLEEFLRLHPEAQLARSQTATTEAMKNGASLILEARLLDVVGRRRSDVQALVRVGFVDATYRYAPLVIKNNEITEAAITRRMREGSLEHPRPSDAHDVLGIGSRRNITMTRNGIALSHATRVLQEMSHHDPAFQGAVVDRQARLWWFNLSDDECGRWSLANYDLAYKERLNVLDGLVQWEQHLQHFPTLPYWHRECLECPYEKRCETELADIDDVSLTRFTTHSQQALLKEHGVATRVALSRLRPELAKRTSSTTPREPSGPEEVLANSIDRFDDLIYRARAHVAGAPLLIVSPDELFCPTAEVEVDVDMESYNDVTYLWGALVSTKRDVEGISPGYFVFTSWEPLTPNVESEVFATFWTWFQSLRDACRHASASFAAYCFWAQAEDGAMNRAVAKNPGGSPSIVDIEQFRSSQPRQWIDMHDVVKRQIQTEGPLGLKTLAASAGFSWRDTNPSGEASMTWYEEAVKTSNASEAERSRKRLLEYNEDDCRATQALRQWINGPARYLTHRDDPQFSALDPH